MQLCWWEAEELLEHLHQRPDLWSSPRENLWLRQGANNDTADCGLAFSPPTQSGPFRQYTVRIVPMAWSVEDCDAYLESLVSKWTDYGTRRKYFEFLTSEANIEPARARLLAIGLCGIEQNGSPDPENCPIPTTRELWPDVEGPDVNVQYAERVLRTYAIVGGGWLTIRLQGGMLRIRASLRSDGRYGGGYDGAFEGFIRPSNGNIAIASAFLYGNEYTGDYDASGRLIVADPSGGLLRDETGHLEYDGVIETGKEVTIERYKVGNVLDERPSTTNDHGAAGGGEDIPQPE